MALSHSQTHAIAQLRREGPGWHRCSVASPTVDALETRGLVRVRYSTTVHVGREKSWRLADPANPDALEPMPTLLDRASAAISAAWSALGFDKYQPDPEPAAHRRRSAAVELRRLVDLLEA